MLLEIFKTHPDAGVHSIAAWALEKWSATDALNQARRQIQSDLPLPGMRWHEDPLGLTFAIFGPNVAFEMGQQGVTEPTLHAPVFHDRILPRCFGISVREVGYDSFKAFEGERLLQMKSELQKLAAGDDGYSKLEKTLGRSQRVTDFQRQPNGFLPAGEVAHRRSIEVPATGSMCLNGRSKTPLVKFMRWGSSGPIPQACSTCWGMSPSGATMALKSLRATILAGSRTELWQRMNRQIVKFEGTATETNEGR